MQSIQRDTFTLDRLAMQLIYVLKLVLLSLAGVLLNAQLVLAQSYPTKPIKLVVPYAPGGPGDILGRLMAQKLTDALGQPVVVDYRAGAGGTIGTEQVARAPADGYTLVIAANGALAINVSLMKNLPYDPRKDLTPIIHVATVPLVLTVHPAVNANSTRELIALMKAKPNGFAYASAGNGTPQHLAGELFKSVVGVSMVHVPYKGTAPAVADLVAGQVPVALENITGVLPHVRGGRLRALATAASSRSSLLPEVPTMHESGVTHFEASAWFGVMAPAGTPRPIVDRLNQIMSKSLDTPELKQRLAALGSDPVHGTPDAFGQFIQSEITKWGKVVRDSGATPE